MTVRRPPNSRRDSVEGVTTTELPASPPTTSPPALALAAAGVTVVLWASAFVAIRHVGPEVSPGALTLGRLLVGSLVLGAVLAVRGFRRPARRDWPLLLVCGLLWFGVYNIALNAAEQRVDAGTTAMLVNVGPLLIALLAGLLLGEGFPRHLVTGSLVAFGGVVVIGAATSGRRRRDGGRPALPRRRGRLRGRRGRPEAAARTAAGARGHLAGLHDRGGRLPAVRAAAGRGGGRRAGLDPRLGRLPRRVPHRDRVHHLGLRPVAHDRRPDGRDHLPGAAGHDRAGLGAAGRDAGRAGLRGRRPVPRRGRARPGVRDGGRRGEDPGGRRVDRPAGRHCWPTPPGPACAWR